MEIVYVFNHAWSVAAVKRHERFSIWMAQNSRGPHKAFAPAREPERRSHDFRSRPRAVPAIQDGRIGLIAYGGSAILKIHRARRRDTAQDVAVMAPSD
jgi:hypothetical protein